MSGRGVSDATSRLQCLAAAALCAVGLGLAVLPPPAPEAADPVSAAATGTEAAPDSARPRAVRHAPRPSASERAILMAV